MNFMRVVIIVLAVTLGLATAVQSSPVLAESAAGPITIEDMERRFVEVEGHYPGEVEPTDEEGRRVIRQALRDIAFENELLALLDERGVAQTVDFQTEIRLVERGALVLLAERALIRDPTRISMNEMRELLQAHSETVTLPARAAFRFMLLDSEEVAEQAIAAMALGEDFETTARRLACQPAEGSPGALVGPIAYEGQMQPAIEEAVGSLPLNTVSEPIQTPVGTILILVESREAERHPTWRSLFATVGTGLEHQRREQRRHDLMPELRERHAVELASDLSPETPDGTEVIRVGSLHLTMGDLRDRARQSAEPEVRMNLFFSEAGIEALTEELLLLCEMDALGLTSSPEVIALQTELAHEHRLNAAKGILVNERTPVASEEELEAFFTEHAEELANLVTAEVQRAWRRSLPPLPPLKDEVLEERSYQVLIEPGRLRWDEGGHLAVLPEPE